MTNPRYIADVEALVIRTAALVPMRDGGAITVAYPQVRPKLIAEAANGGVTLKSDTILRGRGVKNITHLSGLMGDVGVCAATAGRAGCRVGQGPLLVLRREEMPDRPGKNERASAMPDRLLDLRLFRHTMASAEHGSFRRAATILDVQRSTVSRDVRELEYRLEVELFERDHAGIRPTQVDGEFSSKLSKASTISNGRWGDATSLTERIGSRGRRAVYARQ